MRSIRKTKLLLVRGTFLLSVLSIGCSHSELRKAIGVNALGPLTESSIRKAVVTNHPIGSNFATIRDEMRPISDTSGNWRIESMQNEIRLESRNLIPIPPAQASWIVVQLRAFEGKLDSVEVFRRKGSL